MQTSVVAFLEIEFNPIMPGVHKMVNHTLKILQQMLQRFLICILNVLRIPSIAELTLPAPIPDEDKKLS